MITSTTTRNDAFTPLEEKRLERSGLGSLAARVAAGARLSREDGLALYAARDVAAVGMLANRVRERLHGDVTYFVRNRHLNPTNVCEADCLFCAFKADPGDPRGWTLRKEEIQRRVAALVTEDIREVHVVGGHNPDVGYAYYVDTIRWIKEVRPRVHVKAYTMAEIVFFSKISGKPIEGVIEDQRRRGSTPARAGGRRFSASGSARRSCAGRWTGRDGSTPRAACTGWA